MQFLVIGFDDSDDEAQQRRFAVREQHLAMGDQMEVEGTRWYGASFRDDDDKMIGSFAVMDFPDREALDEWLESEPYVKGDVWRNVQVFKCSVRDPWKFNRPREFFESRAQDQSDDHVFAPETIYEDCFYHPVLCTSADYEDDELTGVSLIDGSMPRACSIAHCGPFPLTLQQALLIKDNFDEYVLFRQGGGEPEDFAPNSGK